MEPLAPGTEDEPLYTIPTKSKKEAEDQRALSLKAFLPNGSYGKVFELNYVQGAEHWFCRVCDCPVMGRLFNHEIGKRHTSNLAIYNSNREFEASTGPASNEDQTVQVAPGEPVPPGFEGEVEKIAQIQERLDGFNAGPLVALEYLLELQDYDPSKEPSYLCILCDKKGDPRTVLTHLASYNHITTYLQKHFPTCYRSIAPFMTKQYKRNWQSGLQRVADAIETKYGRLKPIPVEASKFESQRMHYIAMVAKGKHFSELSGVTFENVLTKEELTKSYEDEKKPYDSTMPFRKTVQAEAPKRKSPSPPVVARPIKRTRPPSESKRRKSLSPVSSISSSDLEDFDPAPKSPERVAPRPTVVRDKDPYGGGRSDRLRSDRDRSDRDRSDRDRSDRDRPRDVYRRRSPSPKRKYSPTPAWIRQNRSNKNAASPVPEKRPDDKFLKMEEFKKLSKATENDVEIVYKQHRLHPEKHPEYNDEWKKFWNKRYKELQAEGKNPSTHDFKPEWIEFWNKKLTDLQQVELRTRRAALRKRLGLPEEPAPISFRITKKKPGERDSPKNNKPVPPSARPDNDPEVIVIDDKEDNSKSTERAHSPWEKDVPSMAGGNTRMMAVKRKTMEKVKENVREPAKEREISRERVRSRERELSREHERSKENDRFRRLSRERRPSPPFHDRRRSPPFMRKSPLGGRGSSPQRDRFGRDIELMRGRVRSRERSLSRENSWERSEKHRDKGYLPSRPRREFPWEHPSSSYKKEPMPDCYKPPKTMRDVTRQPVLSPPPTQIVRSPPMIPDVHDDDGDINVVAVLRLLTALEERLGSLGPKVIDLLAQALAMEKKEANSSDNLLDSDINCVLFETVKEKLKGQLLAGFVEYHQEKAFKTAIKKTAFLIYLAGERKKEQEKNKPKMEHVIVPGVGTVDRNAIAKQIANALIAQGKTDVTQAQLEQLINAVVGMAEASKNSNQPMTTATFLEKFVEQPPKPEPAALVVAPKIPEKEPEKELEKEPEPPVITPPSIKIDTKNEFENESPPMSPSEKYVSNMESLSDSDLQTLLQNFKDLSTDEQHGLINYLKKLETKEPERVERLRKFVNLTGAAPQEEAKEDKKIVDNGRESPFSNRKGSVNPAANEVQEKGDLKEQTEEKKLAKPQVASSKITLDSDEEEYSFEDVAKAASQKVKENELELKRQADEVKKANDEVNLADAKTLISTLMSNLNKSSAPAAAASPAKSETSNSGKINIISNIPVSSADFSNISISMSSLGSIMGNVQQNLVKQNQQEQEKKSQKNVFDIFSIGSSDVVEAKKEVTPQLQPPQKPSGANNQYDIFNIEPNPRDFPRTDAPSSRGGNFDYDNGQNRDNVQAPPPNFSGRPPMNQGYPPETARPNVQYPIGGKPFTSQTSYPHQNVQYPVRNQGGGFDSSYSNRNDEFAPNSSLRFEAPPYADDNYGNNGHNSRYSGPGGPKSVGGGFNEEGFGSNANYMRHSAPGGGANTPYGDQGGRGYNNEPKRFGSNPNPRFGGANNQYNNSNRNNSYNRW